MQSGRGLRKYQHPNPSGKGRRGFDLFAVGWVILHAKGVLKKLVIVKVMEILVAAAVGEPEGPDGFSTLKDDS